MARKWSQVYADLQELGKSDVLNHEPKIAVLGDMLPSNSSKDHYIELRIKWLDKGDNELSIMAEFMVTEWK